MLSKLCKTTSEIFQLTHARVMLSLFINSGENAQQLQFECFAKFAFSMKILQANKYICCRCDIDILIIIIVDV